MIAVIGVVITVLHAYVINQNEQFSDKVSAVPRVCIKSLKTWSAPLRVPHILFPFVVDQEKKTSNLNGLYN